VSMLRTDLRFPLALALLALNACVSPRAHLPADPAPAGARYYVDLEPGWRVRVVTPILKSGGYRLKTADQTAGGPSAATLTVKAGPDFLGYEIAWYAVEARKIVFTAAEVHNKDGVVPAAQPIVPLFRLPGEARYVRLIYLVRVSEADHDMAVVAASKVDALDALTAQVRAHPETWGSQRKTFCSWIPDGIAVTPETRTAGAGAEQWAPVH